MARIQISVVVLAAALAVSAGAQTINAGTGTFVDISTTGGTALMGTGDDTMQPITTTIGNAMFPAGSASISNNGFILAGNYTGAGWFTEFDIPTTGLPTNMPTGSWGGILLPHWDDLFPFPNPSNATIWYQEAGGVLAIMYLNTLHYFDNVPADSITFEVLVYSNPGAGPWIQYIYQDTVFGGTYAADDNGASATVGYVGASNPAGNGNVKWSFDMPLLSNGLVLNLYPKFNIAVTSPAGPGSIQIAMSSGPAFGTYFMGVTFNQGSYPNGWFFGIDIGFQELANEINGGFPFLAGLDGSGAFTIGPVSGLPSGLTFWGTALAASQGSPYPSVRTGAFTYAIP